MAFLGAGLSELDLKASPGSDWRLSPGFALCCLYDLGEVV